MPRFHWKGRSADGREVEGDADGASQEDVLGRLRSQRILVTSVTAARGGENPADARLAPAAGPSESHVERLDRERTTQRPRRFRAILIAAAFLLAAIAIGYAAPVTIYRCDRADGETVSCSLTETVLGILTIREQKLDRVSSVEYETRWIDGRDKRGNPTKTAHKRLLLRNPSGASMSPSRWGGDGRGREGLELTTTSIDSAISNLVRGGITGPVHLWQGEWPLLAISGLLVSLGLLMLLLTVLSQFKGPTDSIYAAAGSLAAGADAKRRRQGH